MADSLTGRKLVREHLETHFDEYLSSVSSYLRQTYPELHLTEEASQEIAATVIVRVSHADLDPTHVEQALTDGADEMIRARRPRFLTHSRRGEDLGGPLRAEAPRALPSLRLIQSFGRTPANTDGVSGPESDALGSRLLLANPPRDLGATIGWKDDALWKGDKPVSRGDVDGDAQNATSTATQHAMQDGEDAPADPHSERLDADSLVGAALGGSPDSISARLPDDLSDNLSDDDNAWTAPERDDLVTGEHLRRELGERERDEFNDEAPPPTQRTRRKKATTKTSSKATRGKPKAATKSSKSKSAAKGGRSRAAAARGEAAPAPPAVAPPAVAPLTSAPYVSDDLAVIAMVGFPGNPRRAAKLCVTAMAEELGFDDDADLSHQIFEVTRVLEDLRGEWAQGVPPDAHLVWQKRARQATLRAFLGQRG